MNRIPEHDSAINGNELQQIDGIWWHEEAKTGQCFWFNEETDQWELYRSGTGRRLFIKGIGLSIAALALWGIENEFGIFGTPNDSSQHLSYSSDNYSRQENTTTDNSIPKTFTVPGVLTDVNFETVSYGIRSFNRKQWEKVIKWAPFMQKYYEKKHIFTGLSLKDLFEKEGYDMNLWMAMAWVESNGNNKKPGTSGEVCFLQIIPKESGFDWARNRPSARELKDPFVCAQTSRNILINSILTFGSVKAGLAGYNGSSEYAEEVIWLYKQMKGE